jgi:hypothetical protein
VAVTVPTTSRAVAGFVFPTPTLSFTVSTKRVSVSTTTFPVTDNSFPTSTFPVVVKAVVGFVNWIVCGVTFPVAVIAESSCCASTVTVPMVMVPPSSKFVLT